VRPFRAVYLLFVAVLLMAAAPRAASADENFVDTRLTFTFGDDNFMADAGETMVDSPLIGFGDRPGYTLFFDNLDTQYSGRENLLHLVLYKKMPGFVPGLTTAAAIVVKSDFSDANNIRFQDDGTYLRLVYNFRRVVSKKGPKLDITLFPISTDRFRVGYLYSLTWGGAAIFPGAKDNLTPGAKVSFYWRSGYAFAGMKTARILTNPPPGGGEESTGREAETFYGGLAGFGLNLPARLKFDMSGGYFLMGENPNNGVEGEYVQTFGASARVSHHKGMPIGISTDLKLYRTDAEFLENIGRKESYKRGFSYQISLEGTYVGQVLEDPEKYGTTKIQWGYAGALSAKIKWNYLRAHLTTFLRSVEFILLNVPSFVPYQALSPQVDAKPEVFLATGADYYFKRRRLTVGAMVGSVVVPARVETELRADTGAQPAYLGKRTLVIRDEGDFSILKSGDTPDPIFAAKITVRWDLSKLFTLMGVGLLQYDSNFTNLTTLANGTAQLTTEEPWRVGAMVFAQARY
jgi:hypothetical protein